MAVSGAKFIQNVKVKLNRLDTSEYEDVRPEEVLFFANDALKSLTLAFDIGAYSQLVDINAAKVYLAKLHAHQPEQTLITDNEGVLPETVFKFKDMEAFVTVPATGTVEETGWMDTRWLNNEENSHREDNPFTRSFADTPIFRLIDDTKIKFEVGDFKVTKIRYDYLKYPEVITEASTLTYQFVNELEDKTVTLILENLESRRIQSQPAVSRS